MKEGGLLSHRSQEQKGIVVHRHLPEVRMGEPVHRGEVAKEPARQVDEVHALIDQLTGTRQYRVGSPFLLVSDATTVSVAPTDEHQLAERACIE